MQSKLVVSQRLLALAGILIAFVPLSATGCFGQCIEPAKTLFGPFPPAQSDTVRLADPLVPSGTNSPIKIVTMGDSVVWGNGNIPENKFSVKVAHYIANHTGRSTSIVAYAHSGARLLSTDNGTTVLQDGSTYLQDLNSESPTTTQQETCAAGADSDAEIVLLDGCINETGATNIALPFPFNWVKGGGFMSAAEVRQRAYTACSIPMKDLLISVHSHFLRATVVVINYYQVVTAGSTLFKQGIHSEEPPTEVDELQQEQENLLQLTQPGKKQYFVAPVSPEVSRGAWMNRSIAFLDTSQGCFTWALAAANGLAPGSPSATADSCPTVTLPPASRATPNSRFYLAKIPNDPSFGYGARHTHEWRLPILHRRDDMYAKRAVMCDRQYKTAFQKESCKVNAMAHPNVLGADAYTTSITDLLDKAWATSGGK